MCLSLKNLGIPTIIVGSGVGKTLEELVDSLYFTYDFKVKDVEVLAIIANKVQPEKHQSNRRFESKFTERNFGKCYSIISSLNNPTIKEIVDELMPKYYWW
jgi:phosphate acetyltransferase